MRFGRAAGLMAACILAACEPSPISAPPNPPPPPATSGPVEVSAAPVDTGTPAVPVAYDDSDPVRVAPPVVLRQGSGWRFERQPWKFDETEGIAWRAAFPRRADVTVAARAEVVAFEELLPRADSGPWAAINGGFYEAAGETFRPMGLVVSGGEVQSEVTTRGGSGIFFVGSDGEPRVVHRDDYSRQRDTPSVALQSIDRIVAAGESVVTRKVDAPGAARSAVVVGEKNLWLIVAVAKDDIVETTGGVRLRKSGAGLPLWAFAEYVVATTDVRDALNLDGGVSTQLAVRDGDFSFEVQGVRGTVNAVVLRPSAAGHE